VALASQRSCFGDIFDELLDVRPSAELHLQPIPENLVVSARRQRKPRK
jgi:hypothetical protein